MILNHPLVSMEKQKLIGEEIIKYYAKKNITLNLLF